MSSNRRAADPFDETGHRGRRGGGLLKGASGLIALIATAAGLSYLFGDEIQAFVEEVDAERRAANETFKTMGSDELSKLPPDRYEMAGFKVYFDTGSDTLSDYSKRRISEAYEASAKACEGDLHIRAVGHDDQRSEEQAAYYLGWDRAEAVARHLYDEVGMWGVVSYGSVGNRAPDVRSEGPLAWAQNRRVVGQTFCDTRWPRSEILGEKSPRKLLVDEEEKAKRRAPPFWETYSFSVYFGHGSSEPQVPERFTIEKSMLSAWEACEGALSIELEGHDDFFGDRFSSLDISRERASRVADVMVEDLWATQKGDIRRAGYGREQPKFKGIDSETAALHRRVDAKLYCNAARANAARPEPQDFGLSLVFSEDQQSLSALDTARISSRAKRARAVCAGTLYADATLSSGPGGDDGEQNRTRREASLKRTLEGSGGFDAETLEVAVSGSEAASDAARAEIAFRCEA
ncbi:hypothetical protein HK107_05400 [Parvularcula sp. ZS-1/3]|uniref:OmpA family protein n=1 Tax=Parvularcula mediterranea TaxID=2732508 RepID=A0A7Y3RKJ8_9PROT|nr:hypothetical protein [Parvularcula mediterranea]NNU15754.1 hypothetical protein [Parvularcula mediterranea]